MPSSKPYRKLHNKVVEREGATERLAALRNETLTEVGLYELRQAVNRSQSDLAASLQITQSAVSQLEQGGDIKLSTLRRYLEELGADLQLLAVFKNGDTETAIPVTNEIAALTKTR